jgi:hypothetical protein
MLDLTLREEFRGKRLKGTTVDFTNQSKTGALEVSAAEFLRITYPSFDLLKTIEAIQASIEKSSRSNTKPVERAAPTANPEALGLGDDVAKMRALSIRQPFAEAIMRGTKTTEYRSGPTHIRGRILIYASMSRYGDDEEAEMLKEFSISDVEADDLPRGVIVGSVELYDSDEGEWYLRNPQRAENFVEPVNRPNPVWFYPF